MPVWTSLFLRCIVSIALFRTFARPMIQGVHATGDVKFLNLSSGLFNALTYLPLIYILYWSGLPVWSCFYIHTASAIISSYLEAYSLYKIEKYSMWNYFFDVYLRSICNIAFSIIAISDNCSFIRCRLGTINIYNIDKYYLYFCMCIYYGVK